MMFYLFYNSILISMFREVTSCNWRFSLIIVLIFSSRIVTASELGYDNFLEEPLFVLNNRTSGTPFTFLSISFSRVLNICFVFIVKASIMVQCRDLEQNPGPV